MTEDRYIRHIVVIGFHHAKGNCVEYAYPPFPEADGDASAGATTQRGPASTQQYQWEFLPFLSIPDGAHNSECDYTFFTLPKTQDNVPNIYGTSVYRQIGSKELPDSAKTSEVTRSHVQKSICVLSYLPLFETFRSRLDPVTEIFFRTNDFANVDIIKQLFESLDANFRPVDPILPLTKQVKMPDDLFLGLSLQNMVLLFGRKLLVLYKLLLLERGSLFFAAFPASSVCTAILGLISICTSSFLLLFPPPVHEELKATVDLQFGPPLEFFNKETPLDFYVTLQQFDVFAKEGKGFVGGTCNMLYTRQPPAATDVIIDVSSGEIEMRNEPVTQMLTLTTQDKNFIENIRVRVNEAQAKYGVDTHESEPVDWLGSDAWIRSEFKRYTNCLLHSASNVQRLYDTPAMPDISSLDLSPLAEYNVVWARNWLHTHNYRQWRQFIVQENYLEELWDISEGLPAHPSGPSTAIIDSITNQLTIGLNQLSALDTEPIKSKLKKVADFDFGKAIESAKSSIQTIYDSTAVADSATERIEKTESSEKPPPKTSESSISKFKGWAQTTGASKASSALGSSKWFMSKLSSNIKKATKDLVETALTYNDGNDEEVSEEKSASSAGDVESLSTSTATSSVEEELIEQQSQPTRAPSENFQVINLMD